MANQKSSQTVALLLGDTELEIAEGGHGKCFLPFFDRVRIGEQARLTTCGLLK
jgi:hypothetical protein